jgi:hypothetical protein
MMNSRLPSALYRGAVPPLVETIHTGPEAVAAEREAASNGLTNTSALPDWAATNARSTRRGPIIHDCRCGAPHFRSRLTLPFRPTCPSSPPRLTSPMGFSSPWSRIHWPLVSGWRHARQVHDANSVQPSSRVPEVPRRHGRLHSREHRTAQAVIVEDPCCERSLPSRR